MNEYRLFLALPLPHDIQKKLFQRIHRARIKHIITEPQEQLHLTIKFYGLVGEDHIPSLLRSIEETLIGTTPFSIIIDKPGCFPTEKKPKILWFGISGDVARLTRITNLFKDKDDKQEFMPHITTGKIDQRITLKEKQETWQKFKKISFPKPIWFDATELTLFRSKLTASHPIYTKIATFSLQ